MTTTENLTRILGAFQFEQGIELSIEAEPAWFPKGQHAAEPAQDGEPGEAQAIITINGKAYCISLEELP